MYKQGKNKITNNSLRLFHLSRLYLIFKIQLIIIQPVYFYKNILYSDNKLNKKIRH